MRIAVARMLTIFAQGYIGKTYQGLRKFTRIVLLSEIPGELVRKSIQ